MVATRPHVGVPPVWPRQGATRTSQRLQLGASAVTPRDDPECRGTGRPDAVIQILGVSAYHTAASGRPGIVAER